MKMNEWKPRPATGRPGNQTVQLVELDRYHPVGAAALVTGPCIRTLGSGPVAVTAVVVQRGLLPDQLEATLVHLITSSLDTSAAARPRRASAQRTCTGTADPRRAPTNPVRSRRPRRPTAPC